MRFTITASGVVFEADVDRGEMRVHAITHRLIVLHVAGTGYWRGIGQSRGYAPAHFLVVQPDEVAGNGTAYNVTGRIVAEFPVARTPVADVRDQLAARRALAGDALADAAQR